VLDDLYGSDHFPILISILRNQTVPTITAKLSFKLKDADWNLFKEKITFFSSVSIHSLNVNQEAAIIKEILIHTPKLLLYPTPHCSLVKQRAVSPQKRQNK